MSNDDLSNIFVRWTLLDWWDTLLQAYKEMGFTDELSDETRIKEFTEITKMMNNWIEKVEKKISPFWLFEKEKAIELFSQMNERIIPDTRVKIVYTRSRDNWNEMIYIRLQNILKEAQHKVEKEEGSDTDGSNRNHYEF